MVNLVPITYDIPKNYSPCPLVVFRGGEILFKGFLHRTSDIDGIEGMDGNPVRLERDGQCFHIPEEWKSLLPRLPQSKREVLCL